MPLSLPDLQSFLPTSPLEVVLQNRVVTAIRLSMDYCLEQNRTEQNRTTPRINESWKVLDCFTVPKNSSCF